MKVILSIVKLYTKKERARMYDKAYFAALDRRCDEFENGQVKGILLDELEARARLAYKSKKRKK